MRPSVTGPGKPWGPWTVRRRGGGQSRWRMPTRARGVEQSLLVVDLESRGGPRGVLEWRARRMAKRIAARGRPVQVLLHLPDGSGPSPGWPAGAPAIRTVDRVSLSRLQDIHERVFAASFEVVRGSTAKVFPEVCGIGLGELNLLLIQRYLASFAVLSAALQDLLDAGEVRTCHILSADLGFARALERQVAGRVESVSSWPPRQLLEVARWVRAK